MESPADPQPDILNHWSWSLRDPLTPLERALRRCPSAEEVRLAAGFTEADKPSEELVAAKVQEILERKLQRDTEGPN
jgi:hypothetical protein